MSRIREIFQRRQRVLVTYVCVGYPTEEESIRAALDCAEAGADILELGIPFSDPTADGPVIARASRQALEQGTSIANVLSATAHIRARSQVGIILFGYYNPIWIYGEERFARDAARAGADGVLVVDLPLEESASLRTALRVHGLSLVPLVAPTTAADRVALLRDVGAEWIYSVSVAGVTGSASAPLEEASARAAALRAMLDLPVVVGFGVDSPEKARVAGAKSDGVVCGSALVTAITEKRTADLVRSLREALGSLS